MTSDDFEDELFDDDQKHVIVSFSLRDAEMECSVCGVMPLRHGLDRPRDAPRYYWFTPTCQTVLDRRKESTNRSVERRVPPSLSSKWNKDLSDLYRDSGGAA